MFLKIKHPLNDKCSSKRGVTGDLSSKMFTLCLCLSKMVLESMVYLGMVTKIFPSGIALYLRPPSSSENMFPLKYTIFKDKFKLIISS
jgi:hypothetical protein